MKTFSCSLLALATVAALPALAQNTEAFEGFHFGTEIGIQKNKIDATAPGVITLDGSDKGYALRGFAGYDVAISDALLLGGEIGLGLGGPDVKETSGTASLRADPGITLDLSARAGFAVNDSILLYGRAGYSNSKIDVTTSNTAIPSTTISSDKRKGGLLLGAGGEWAMTDALNLRLEYRRAKHGDLKSDQVMLGGVIRF